MAIYKENIVDIDLSKGKIHRQFLAHSIGSGDNGADRFGIRVFRNREEVDLSGCSCYGYFLDPQGNPIALTDYGTVDGNVAYVTLPQACYNYDGQFNLSIKLIGSGVTGTMRIVDGVVDNTHTGGAVAPTGAVPTYTEVLAQYDAMVAATAAANGAIAPTFDATKAYTAGQYVINDGSLYRLTADHAANVTWANTSKVEVKFGNELSDVKSAINESTERINLYEPTQVLDASVNSSSGAISSSNNAKTVWCKCKANKYYTVSKTAGTRFVVGFTSVQPAINGTASRLVSDNTAGSITAYSGSNEYLVAYVYLATSDSGTAQDMLASVKINEGTQAVNINITAKDYVSRDEIGKIKNGEDVPKLVKSIIGKNLFDKRKITDGYFNSGGSISSLDTLCISDYIPVEYGITYKNVNQYSGGGYSCYYDDNYDFISSVSADSASFTPPQNAKYIRLTLVKANIDTHMFGVSGTIASAHYIPYIEYPAVRYDIEMPYLSDEEKARARNNIGAEAQSSGNDALYGKKLMVFGDSISYGSNNDGISYADKIAILHSMTLSKYTTPGATWCQTSGRSCLRIMVNNVVTDDTIPAPDYIILSGGYNDSQNSVLNPLGVVKVSSTSDNNDAFNGVYDEDTVSGSLERAIYRLRKKYASAKILYVITYDITSQKEWSQTYAPQLRKICKKWSIPIADIMEDGNLICCSLLTDMYANIFTDNVHPNDAGQNMIAKVVNDKLKLI